MCLPQTLGQQLLQEVPHAYLLSSCPGSQSQNQGAGLDQEEMIDRRRRKTISLHLLVDQLSIAFDLTFVCPSLFFVLPFMNGGSALLSIALWK